jgi:hypothetical protein
MVQRALNRWASPAVEIPLSSVYDSTTQDRMLAFQLEQEIKPASGLMGDRTLDALAPYFDAYGRWRYRTCRIPKPTPVPKLGPVWRGGKSVLDHDLTHATSGIPLYPAFDDAFAEGTEIVAPEPLVVTRPSSARPGEAFYCLGASRIRYWFGHLDRTHQEGRKFVRGEVMARVAPNKIGGGPHVHVGVNVELLLGGGRQLLHHTNYTHGAPTVGEQLERALL